MSKLPESEQPAQTASLSILDRMAERKMQTTPLPEVADAAVKGKPALALKRIREDQSGTGYAAKLRKKIYRTGGGFSSSANTDAPEVSYDLLRQMLAEKIAEQTGKRPHLSAQEIALRLNNDDFIQLEYGAKRYHEFDEEKRYKTTEKAGKKGITQTLRGVGMPGSNQYTYGPFSFNGSDLIKGLERNPNVFNSLYQDNGGLNGVEIQKRLERKGHIGSSTRDSEHLAIKTQALQDKLTALRANFGHNKEYNETVIRKLVFTELLKKHPLAFDELVREPIKLTPPEIIEKLVFKVMRRGQLAELRVQTDEGAYVLRGIGVNVDNVRGGRLVVQEPSLRKVLDGDEDVLRRIKIIEAPLQLVR